MKMKPEIKDNKNETPALPPVLSMPETFGLTCYNCKSQLCLEDYKENYCSKCGMNLISVKRHRNFLNLLTQKNKMTMKVKNETFDLPLVPSMPETFGLTCYNCKKELYPEDFEDNHCPWCGVPI